MKPAILELAQELTGQPDPESAMSEVLHAYLQLKIRRCRRLIARLERKYGMGFEEFARRLGVELPLSWEHERDFLAWEEALTNLRYFQEQPSSCMPMLRDFVEQVGQAARAYPWIVRIEARTEGRVARMRLHGRVKVELLARELAQRGRI